HRMDSDKIYAAISCYLLLGIFWALIYALTEEIDPTSFGRVMPQWGGSFSDLIYFSFCTLTTLGYGDLVPHTAVTQTLSYLEAVSGQLFVAILIARLVGLNIAQMAHDRRTGENE
ncbi:MAG: ion channel, partial [Candidatus Aureabacteria bacterium]|nr:ion channel [Candidatus Auribacterota bacterium]